MKNFNMNGDKCRMCYEDEVVPDMVCPECLDNCIDEWGIDKTKTWPAQRKAKSMSAGHGMCRSCFEKDWNR